MKNLSHSIIIEGKSDDVVSKAREMCVEILGNEFENKIQKDCCSDVVWIRNNKDKTLIGIDEIRSVKNSILFSPIECKAKVYVIANSEKMTEQAQNSILKVLEEPPENIFFLLLCSNSNNLIKTIKSRSQLIVIQKESSIRCYGNEKKANQLVKSTITEDFLQFLEIISSVENRNDLKEMSEICRKIIISEITDTEKNLHSLHVLKELSKCHNLLNSNANLHLVVSSLFLNIL